MRKRVPLPRIAQEMRLIYDAEKFHPRLLLRLQEISNGPEVVRRLGIISFNTAIEFPGANKRPSSAHRELVNW
jgi:hypothetical protein